MGRKRKHIKGNNVKKARGKRVEYKMPKKPKVTIISDEEKEEILNEETVENTAANEASTEASEQVEDATVESSLADKILEMNDKHLRLMADFENYKRKTIKERADLIKYGGEQVFINLLPIIDDFERAIQHLPEEDSPIKEGIVLIHNKFTSFLNSNGVKEIETKDAEFNTDFHEAISLFPAPSPELKGKIIDCTQKGYMFHDKVIRFSKVVVAE